MSKDSVIRNIKSQPYLWLLIIFFLISYSVWTVARHNQFRTDAIDLGIFDQIIWKYSQFKTPLSSIKFNTYPGPNILGDHSHFILVLLAPLYWVWSDARILLVAQVIAVVASVWPLYQLALKKIRSTFFAFMLCLNFLIFIGLQTLLEYDFHEIAFALPLLTFAFYFLDAKKYRWYFLTVILAILVKEDMPLVTATLGIWAILKLKEYRVGLATLVISIFSYWLITYQLIPFFKRAPFDYEHLSPELGRSSTDLIKTTLTDPWLVIKTAFYDAQWIKAKTMINLLLSYSFLSLLSPSSLIMLIPNIVSRFLTDLPQRWIIRFQYSAIWDTVLAVGAIYATTNLLKWKEKLGISGLTRPFLITLSLAMVLASLYVTRKINGPLVERVFNPSFYQTQDHFSKNRVLLKQIPSTASVMAQSAFVPHLSHRDEIYRYEDNFFARTRVFPDYIIMSVDEHSDPPYLKEDLYSRILTLKDNPNYEVLSWDGKRLLEKKKQ